MSSSRLADSLVSWACGIFAVTCAGAFASGCVALSVYVWRNVLGPLGCAL